MDKVAIMEYEVIKCAGIREADGYAPLNAQGKVPHYSKKDIFDMDFVLFMIVLVPLCALFLPTLALLYMVINLG